MDNNTAERSLRNPVVGRKHYYGSGRVWSAHLAARMCSMLQTVWRWGLNPHRGLNAFLHACAENGGQSPPDLSAFLPWQMTPERREELARPVPVPVPPVARHTPDRGAPEAGDTSECLICLVAAPPPQTDGPMAIPRDRPTEARSVRLSDRGRPRIKRCRNIVPHHSRRYDAAVFRCLLLGMGSPKLYFPKTRTY
jgi:hypothetical protein